MTLFDDSAFLAAVNAAKERWELPTVCVSVSTDTVADVGLTKWFGSPSSGPVDRDSIIPIASNTKFFTAVGLAILVEEGKLKWTDRVADLVTGLKLVDEEATRILTLEDILSHRSGMPSCIEAESSRKLTISDAVEVVNAVKPTEPALKVYQYNNACWDLGGHIIAKFSGQPYADFIEQRILKPLGMLSSSYGTPVHPEKQVSAAVAIPGYGSQDIEPLGLARDAFCAPGGGLLSTPNDMSIWLRYLTRLYNDKLSADEPRIIKTSTLREMLRSRSLAGHQIGGVPTQPGESLFKEMSVPTYALGQYRCHYRGMDMVYHWGHITGGGSVMLWLPEKNFSLIVWSNVANAACGAAPAIALMALDAHFGFETVDWTERFWTLPTGKPDIPMPPKDSKPDLSTLERYTGTFWALAYGQLHIFRPNALPADLPQSAALKLGLIKKARVFGPATERQPDLLAVYENDSFVIGCVAMYAVGPSTFWSHNNELADLSRVPTAKTDDVVAMPHSVKTFEAVGIDTWEFARLWQEKQLEKGKGSATFKRIRVHME